MEEDDEFGDLYTDVLKPFESSAASQPSPTPSHLNCPIDLNLQSQDQDSFYGALHFNQKRPDETLAFDPVTGDGGEENSAPGSRVSESDDLKLPNRTSKDASYEEISGGDDDTDMKFDIEEGDTDNAPVIPGLSIGVGGGESLNEIVHGLDKIDKHTNKQIGGGREGGGEEGDDWDSDSEDDLQIVLNDNKNDNGMMGAEIGPRAGGDDDDDDEEDDDEDPLVIVADTDPNHAMEEQQWGEDAAQAVEGEKKDAGEAGKANGGGTAAPRTGYSSHGYHPFHSQFKYVRPGASPIPGGIAAGPGGTAGQARPPVNMGPIAGRGRGDLCPPGLKNTATTLKGFGLPWGTNAAGRGFGGGLDFTLPSHKTIFEVDIDGFEEKPWRHPGVDITDFFNFGLNGESWKEYCKQLEQRRMETTMQGRIRVYECGRTDQSYDPDLPPELAAASGIQSVAADSANFGKPDAGQSDSTKASVRMRPSLPTGRPIPVESGSGERLPSVDTRPPRIRDADTIIEIVCEHLFGDESSAGNGVDQVDINIHGEGLSGDTGLVNGRRAHEGSPHQTPSQSEQDKMLLDKPDENSTESVDGRDSVPSSSPAADKDSRSSSVDHKELVTEASRGSMIEEEETHQMSSRVQLSATQEDDGGDSKADRSSESSKARSGSHRDYQQLKDGLEEEVMQDRRRVLASSSRKQLDENEQHRRRRSHDGRQDVERSSVRNKSSRENSYSHGDYDSSFVHHSHLKSEDIDRRKERDISGGAWRRRDDDPYSRKSGDEGSRKRDRDDDLGSRNRSKTRESETRSKDEHLHARKQLDDGGLRVHNDKEVGSLHKEKDDNLRSSYEADDYYSKRRKDDEYLRRGRADKNETLHGQKESVSRLKRGRDERLEQQKRDVQQKNRDDFDDHDRHFLRHRDEHYLQRDGSERQREREEWDNLKQANDESLSVRGGERQAAIRSQRGIEDRGLSRAKDEYKASEKEYLAKDTTLHSKQHKRWDHINEESSSHHRGHEDVSLRSNQFVSNEKRSRQERSRARSDKAIDASDGHRAQEKRYKESKRNNKEPGVGDVSNLGPSRSKQEDQNGTISEMASKGTSESGHGKNKIPLQPNSARKHKEDASSDDEQKDSRRGRSKLERWTNLKERDYSISAKSSVSLKFQEIDKNPNRTSTKTSKPARDSVSNKQPFSEEKGGSDPVEIRDAAHKPSEDRHLDTVEKLKKRSERFKLPMPNDKDGLTIKKMESEALPSAKNDTNSDSVIKPERPARKRRWTGS